MKVTFDSAKNLANLAKHGVALAEAELLDWDTAMIWVDARRDFGEVRLAALAYLHGRLHRVAFTERDGGYRIISLRKASTREKKIYA